MIRCYGFKAQASACAWNTATRQRCDMIHVDELTFCFSPNVQHAFFWTCSSKVICGAYIVYWLCICLVSLVLRLPCHTFSVCFEELDIAVNIAHKFSLNKSSEGYQRQNWRHVLPIPSGPHGSHQSDYRKKAGRTLWHLMTRYDKDFGLVKMSRRFGFVLSSLGLHLVHVCRSLVVACRETPMFSYMICSGCWVDIMMPRVLQNVTNASVALFVLMLPTCCHLIPWFGAGQAQYKQCSMQDTYETRKRGAFSIHSPSCVKVLTEINRTGKECIFRIDFACFSIIRISDEVYLLEASRSQGDEGRTEAWQPEVSSNWMLLVSNVPRWWRWKVPLPRRTW